MTTNYESEARMQNGKLVIVREVYQGRPYEAGKDPLADSLHEMTEKIMRTAESHSLKSSKLEIKETD